MLLRGINEHLMVIRLLLKGKTHITLISAYVSTLACTDEEKELFEQELRKLVHSMPCEDELLLLDDFNAHVGHDALSWPNTIGKHISSQMNTNGQLFLSYCAENNLAINQHAFPTTCNSQGHMGPSLLQASTPD